MGIARQVYLVQGPSLSGVGRGYEEGRYPSCETRQFVGLMGILS